MSARPILWIVVPCYNEEQVLPLTAPMFVEKLQDLAGREMISPNSRILFVNDGSADRTWEIIRDLAAQDEHYIGICQSRNRGHQNAVLAGLMEARGRCDITISIDCDGQDDINAMDRMVEEYLNGAEVVYGVRAKRDKDSFFKRFTAESFYKLMKTLGAEVVFNHADYRLISAKVLEHFADFEEVNIFLRGMVPLVGFPSATVSYDRAERLAGKSHYPLRKMLALAFNGITSLSVKPITLITTFGIGFSLVGLALMIWAVIQAILGNNVAGWTSTVGDICLLGGIQLISLGVLGQYIGKTYLETKHRPRYIISARTWEKETRRWIEDDSPRGRTEEKQT
jgi:glycosyltransferase involved in cell wall biosynthesis